MLSRYNFLSFFVLTLVYSREFAFTQLRSSDKFFVKTHVATFNSKKTNPIFNYFFVFVIISSCLYKLTFIGNGKTMCFCLFILDYLVYKHTLKEYHKRWNRLFFVVVDKKSLITQDVIPCSHCACSFTYLQQFTFFNYLRINRRNRLCALFRRFSTFNKTLRISTLH